MGCPGFDLASATDQHDIAQVLRVLLGGCDSGAVTPVHAPIHAQRHCSHAYDYFNNPPSTLLFLALFPPTPDDAFLFIDDDSLD
jgi:hypothetical protein